MRQHKAEKKVSLPCALFFAQAGLNPKPINTFDSRRRTSYASRPKGLFQSAWGRNQRGSRTFHGSYAATGALGPGGPTGVGGIDALGV